MGCHAHYSASKWAMEGLSEALAQEMAEFNVKVSIIEPGCVLTPIWGKGSLPTDVATAIEHAIESDKPHFRYPVGPDAEETIAARARVSDDEWPEVNCLQGDAFYDRWQELVGVDYYRD